MIAFAADLHLTRFMWRSRRDLEGDAFRALLSMEETIFKVWNPPIGPEELHIVFAGDIFDQLKVDGATLKAFTDFVDRWYERGVTVYFIQGNHDNDAKEAIAGIQGAEHIHKTTVELDGLTFYGLDWMPREKLHEALNEAPECDYVVLHAMFDHLVDFEAATDVSLDDIPPQIKNVLVGDVHIRDISPLRGSGVCISPGPLHPCTVDQTGPHGVHILRKGAPEWEFHSHSTREIRRFKCLDEGGMEKAREVVGTFGAMADFPEGLEPILEIRYSAEFAEEIREWPMRFMNLKFFLKASASGKMVTSRDLEEAQKSFKTLTLENSLDVIVDDKKEPEVFGFLQALLTGDPRTVIDEQLEGIPCIR